MTDLEKAAAQAAQSDVAAAGLDPTKKRARAPYAGKEARKNGAGRPAEVLSDPMPAEVDPTTQLGVLGPLPESVPDDGLDLPESLKVKNRKPLTPEQQARVDARTAASQEKATKQAELRAAQRAAKDEEKRVRAQVRKEKRAAQETGKTSVMPPSGKVALAVIDARTEEEIEMAKKAKKRSAAAKTRKGPVPGAKKAAGDGKSKVAIIGALLKRPQGCMTTEILAATGWPTVSVPAMAKAAGLSLRKAKEKGSPTVYFGS